MSQRIHRLHDQISKLEKKLADVCADHSELHHELSPFLARYQSDILPFQQKLMEVKREIADLRVLLGDRSAQQPASGNTPLNQLLDTQNATVEEQYNNAWSATRIDETSNLGNPASPEVQQLYRELIPKIFPGFAETEEQAEHRLMLFKRANHAYVRRDERALQAMLDSHATKQTNLPAVVDPNLADELQEYVIDLEKAVAHVEGEVFDLRYGEISRLRELDKEAKYKQVDLLKKLRKDMKTALRQAVAERERLREQFNQGE